MTSYASSREETTRTNLCKMDGNMVWQSVGWLITLLVGWMIGWSDGLFNGWMVDWMVVGLI